MDLNHAIAPVQREGGGACVRVRDTGDVPVFIVDKSSYPFQRIFYAGQVLVVVFVEIQGRVGLSRLQAADQGAVGFVENLGPGIAHPIDHGGELAHAVVAHAGGSVFVGVEGQGGEHGVAHHAQIQVLVIRLAAVVAARPDLHQHVLLARLHRERGPTAAAVVGDTERLSAQRIGHQHFQIVAILFVVGAGQGGSRSNVGGASVERQVEVG